MVFIPTTSPQKVRLQFTTGTSKGDFLGRESKDGQNTEERVRIQGPIEGGLSRAWRLWSGNLISEPRFKRHYHIHYNDLMS